MNFHIMNFQKYMESKRTEEMLQPWNCVETTRNMPSHSLLTDSLIKVKIYLWTFDRPTQ